MFVYVLIPFYLSLNNHPFGLARFFEWPPAPLYCSCRQSFSYCEFLIHSNLIYNIVIDTIFILLKIRQ